VTPATARKTSSTCQRVANAEKIVSIDEARSDAIMSGVRPRASDTAPATIIAGASRPVVSDNDRLLCAAVSPNSRANTGNSGWTQ
jgi:hypothetical protein